MLGTLGDIALLQGDIDSAIQSLKRAHSGLELHGNPDLSAAVLINLGLAMHLSGDSNQAESMLREALQVHWECQRISAIPDNLIRLAWIAVDRQDFPRAVRLMGAVNALRKQSSTPFLERDQIFHQPRLQMAKSSLNPVDFDLYWRAGQAMDCKAAVAYILSW